ncbi:MAG: acyltransferase [Actinobacteria bacterium]|nr:MAG: acyltransferase [Actinomycetota bacterium]
MFWNSRKKGLKLLAKQLPGNRLRVGLLRLAGYRIGERVYVGEDLIITDELEDREQVVVEDGVSIGPRVTLVCSSYPNFSKTRPWAPVQQGPILLEREAWLGAGAIVLPNVRVGSGAVVGAGSVVTRDVPANAVVAGSPARVLRRLRLPHVQDTDEREETGEKDAVESAGGDGWASAG